VKTTRHLCSFQEEKGAEFQRKREGKRGCREDDDVWGKGLNFVNPSEEENKEGEKAIW